MGYDLNKFVDIQNLPNHLKCLICNLILQDPLKSPCDHYFCNQCITIHLQSINHCPHHDEDSVSVKSDKKKSPLRKMSFRKIIGKSPKDKFPSLKLSELTSLSENLIEELNALKVLCDFSVNGCKEQLTLSGLKEHVKQCEFIDSKLNEQMSVEIEAKNSIQNQNHQQETSSSGLLTDQQDDQQQSNTKQEKTVEKQTRVESNSEQLNSDSSNQTEESTMGAKSKDTEKRKNSEAKSLNGEVNKLNSEEEIGSDDFVVIQKDGVSSTTKSTESVQTTNSEPTLIDSKENVNKDDTTGAAEKKKKKKKKKKNANKPDEDAISLKETDSNSQSEISGGSKTQSKESLVESEEVRRALKDAEAKSDNLKLINNQLLGQIKKLKDEREEFTKQLESKLGAGEVDELKAKIKQLEEANKEQTHKIIRLLGNNEMMNKYIISLREDQSHLKEKYNATLNEVNQTLKLVKTCK